MEDKIAKLNIVRMPIAMLKPAPYNPRVSVRDDPVFYKKLERSIERWGYDEPLVWNRRTGHVVGGNQRLEILRDKGYLEVDVHEVDLSLEDEKALNVALNKISGEWDLPKLNELMAGLKSMEYDLSITGFDVDELVEILKTEIHTIYCEHLLS